jgi:hypothetical protein
MVCTEDKPGRTVVLLPACNSADNIRPHAVNADVMVAAAGAAAAYSGGQIGAGLGRCAQQWRVRNLLVTAMPISERPAGGSIVRGRLRSSSSSEEGSQEEQQQQQQQEPQPLDPAAAAALSVISEQYTRGTVIPARDDLSLILEENLGELDPPEIDLEEVAAAARATCLHVSGAVGVVQCTHRCCVQADCGDDSGRHNLWQRPQPACSNACVRLLQWWVVHTCQALHVGSVIDLMPRRVNS